MNGKKSIFFFVLRLSRQFAKCWTSESFYGLSDTFFFVRRVVQAVTRILGIEAARLSHPSSPSPKRPYLHFQEILGHKFGCPLGSMAACHICKLGPLSINLTPPPTRSTISQASFIMEPGPYYNKTKQKKNQHKIEGEMKVNLIEHRVRQ